MYTNIYIYTCTIYTLRSRPHATCLRLIEKRSCPPPCTEAPQSTSISGCCTLPTYLFIVIGAWGNSNDWWGYVGGWVRHPLLMSTASYVACPEVWSEAMPMTASCLLSMSGFETLLRYERMMPLMWDQAADWLPYQPRLPICTLAATWQKNWQINENPKSWSQRVLEQGLPTAISHATRMQYLHYPNPKYTRSIWKSRTNM